MLRGFLIDERNNRRIEVITKIVIGRTNTCDFPIEDSAASRKHVEVQLCGDRFIWKDLNSTNGTAVNDAIMQGGELHSGDTIRIGDTVIRFESQIDPDSSLRSREQTLFRGSIIESSGEIRKEVTGNSETPLLEAVYSVMNEIATTYDPCALMNRVLEAISSTTNAQRAAIFLSKDGETLSGCHACGKVHSIQGNCQNPVDIGDIQISSSVAERVLHVGESIFYQAGADGGLGLCPSTSIMALNLHSIICAPLRAKNGILGILYIDSDRSHQAYTHADMLLVSALGNSAGLALENAAMHQEILEKQRIEQELETAWIIQQSFLVKDWPENIPHFEVYGETHPAKTVGGDFYDFVRPEENVVGILIGDVSGKGISAALTMAQLLAEFRLFARGTISPAAVIRALNAGLAARAQRGLFCTLCYIRLDLSTGSALCANAGHSAAIRINARGATSFGEASGPPLGILPDGPWADEPVTLVPGETILLYTDGIIEARRTTECAGGTTSPHEQFETERLHASVMRCFGSHPRKVLETVNEDVRLFCAPSPPHDDCTMIALRYLFHAD